MPLPKFLLSIARSYITAEKTYRLAQSCESRLTWRKEMRAISEDVLEYRFSQKDWEKAVRQLKKEKK